MKTIDTHISNLDYIELEKKYSDKLPKALKKIEKGYPVQYLIGNVSFFGYEINVNKHVLIPRFETELLVEKTLKKAKKNTTNIIDLGTGSGCIAIALKKKLPDAQVLAIDISSRALLLAKKNAVKNKAEIIFKKENILKHLKGKYDLIISNPPYISKDEDIMFSVAKYEPHKALYAGEKGLKFYKRIISNSVGHISKDGLIALEIGHTQKEAIINIAKNYFPNAVITCEQDYNNLNRFIFIKMNK